MENTKSQKSENKQLTKRINTKKTIGKQITTQQQNK